MTPEEILRLVRRGADVPDPRAERVEALRRAVRAGTYQPNIETLAAKLIDVVGPDRTGEPLAPLGGRPLPVQPSDPARPLFGPEDGPAH